MKSNVAVILKCKPIVIENATFLNCMASQNRLNMEVKILIQPSLDRALSVFTVPDPVN